MKIRFIIVIIFVIISARSVGAAVELPPTGSKYAYLNANTLDSIVANYFYERLMDITAVGESDFIILSEEQKERERGISLDSIYKVRLGMMTSIVNLPYNDIVRKQIDKYVKYRKSSGNLFGLSMYYFPLFEKELEAAGLPTELKLLAVIESGLRPTVSSWAGAAGLWQFTYSTGKMHGLTVNSYIDERYDPILSTKAACKFLKKLYDIYGDWTLVLAAYNCGPGNVNKALAKVPNANTFWDIYYYLPTETRGYVPAFIGATYAYTFHKEHDISFTMPSHTIVTDTVMISNQLLHLEQVSSTISNLSIKTLRALNPMYKLDIIPALTKPYHLVLPLECVSEFIDKKEDIYAKAEDYLSDYLDDASKNMVRDGYVIHTVKSGEVLGLIAKRYRVKVNDIMKWNSIKSAKHLRVGQKLRIFL